MGQKEESQKVKELVYDFPSWTTTQNLGYQDGNRRVLFEWERTVLEENGNEKKEAIKKKEITLRTISRTTWIIKREGPTAKREAKVKVKNGKKERAEKRRAHHRWAQREVLVQAHQEN